MCIIQIACLNQDAISYVHQQMKSICRNMWLLTIRLHEVDNYVEAPKVEFYQSLNHSAVHSRKS